MFMRYSDGLGYGDSATVAEVVVDPAEVVYETRRSLSVEDADEESDDGDETRRPMREHRQRSSKFISGVSYIAV